MRPGSSASPTAWPRLGSHAGARQRQAAGAVISWIGNGVYDGAQGPDISAIPSIALRQIEVLRDGAAA